MPPTSITCYRNCRSLRDGELVWRDVWVRDGKIIDPLTAFYNEHCAPSRYIECEGYILSPGFIDLQVNGGIGCDFSSSSLRLRHSIQLVANDLLKHGVTALCPTIITSDRSTYHSIFDSQEPIISDSSKQAAAILGLHLEGPFISKCKSGMHPKQFIIDDCTGAATTARNVYGCQDFSEVAMVTLAPELPNATQMVRELRAEGVSVCVGHSAASLEQGELAIRAGANMVTHLFCAMEPYHHRSPHLLGLLVSDQVQQPVRFGIIADINHTHYSALHLANKCSPSGLVLVSDACPLRGLPDGNYEFGSVPVTVSDGICKIRDSDTLAGSMATLADCVQNLHSTGVCSPAQALMAATAHPADVLGLTTRGRIQPGAKADLLLLDPHSLKPKQVYIAGELVVAN